MTEAIEVNVPKLVKGDAQILREETDLFDFNNPPIDPIEFAHILTQSMIEHGGIALSANQIGYKHRALVIRSQPVVVMYNPKLVWSSPKESFMDEGCRSYPGLTLKIWRPEQIRVRYAQPNSQIVTKTFTGMTARCILHELDHLHGNLFYKRAHKLHQERAFRKARKLEKRRNK